MQNTRLNVYTNREIFEPKIYKISPLSIWTSREESVACLLMMYRDYRRESKNFGELTTSKCLSLGQSVTVEQKDSECVQEIKAREVWNITNSAGNAIQAILLCLSLVAHFLRSRHANYQPTPQDPPPFPMIEMGRADTPTVQRMIRIPNWKGKPWNFANDFE